MIDRIWQENEKLEIIGPVKVDFLYFLGRRLWHYSSWCLPTRRFHPHKQRYRLVEGRRPIEVRHFHRLDKWRVQLSAISQDWWNGRSFLACPRKDGHL